MKRPASDRLCRFLDRLFPHDTLMIGGRPYMDRWYVAGYAPDPEHPDKRMVCATCRADVYQGPNAHHGGGAWAHVAEVMDIDHDAIAVSAERPGWRWRDHGLGAVRIHRTVASDDSRAFHDHPWPFTSVGLRGTYVEKTPHLVVNGPDGKVTEAAEVAHPSNPRRRFSAPFVNRKRATDLHVLEVEDGPVWTLFFTRPKTRSWGFAGPFGWVGWREFDQRFPERDAWVET